MKKIFIPAPGVAFLVPSEKGHIYVILTPPLGRKGAEEVLVVGATSSKVDPEFTLGPGDHPFIKHRSYINYPRVEIFPVEELRKNLESVEKDRKYKLQESAHSDVVKYICRGLLESRYSSPRHIRFYEKALKKSR